MSGRDRRVDKCITYTLAYLLRCPRLSVPESMQACTFTLDDSVNQTTQMAIRQTIAKATGGEIVVPLMLFTR